MSSAAFGNVLDMSEVIWECLRVAVGRWRAYGGLRGVFGRLFPSDAFNSRKSQIRFMTFSSRPGGPRCFKYQNVPELRSF